MAAKISIILQTSKHSAVFLVIFFNSIYSYTVIQFYFGGCSCPLFMILLIYIFIYILIIKIFQKMVGLKTNCILYNCIESVFIQFVFA